MASEVSFNSTTLAYTRLMACREDGTKFRDGLSLSQSLQMPNRNHFHKNGDPVRKGNNTTRGENPFTKKSITELLSTSLRTHCNQPFQNIVEAISIALVDFCNESYGSPEKTGSDGDTSHVKVGIDLKEIKHLVYKCTNLSFNPNTCTWTGMACYSCEIEMKTQAKSKMQKVRVPCSGNFMFEATCQSVEIFSGRDRLDRFQSSDSIVEDLEWSPSKIHSDKMKTKVEGNNHFCVDIQATFSGADHDDIRAQYDRNTLKVISQTLTHIGYDISRALFWLDLPDFPQGCRDVKFRSIYQLNKKVSSRFYAYMVRSSRIR